jgi:rubrerythrin
MEDTLITNNNKQDQNNGSINPTGNVPVTNEIAQQDANPEDLDSRWLRWKCLKCGYLYEGAKELKKCPRCGNEDPDYFEDAD